MRVLILPFAALLTGQLAAMPASGEEWRFAAGESRISFVGTQVGDLRFEGEFRSFDADITFDGESPENSRVTITVDMASAETGHDQRDQIIRMSEWFNTADFPAARFELSGLAPTGDGAFDAAGQLTIRDRKETVQLALAINDEEGGLSCAVGSLTVDRREFNVGGGEWGETEEWVRFPIDIIFRICARRVVAPEGP